MSGDKVPIRNDEGYLDLTAKRMDEPDYRHYRLIKTLLNLIDLMGYDLMSRIEVRDRKSGRVYR